MPQDEMAIPRGRIMEIHNDLLCVIFVKPIGFEEGYFNFREGGPKKSNQANF